MLQNVKAIIHIYIFEIPNLNININIDALRNQNPWVCYIRSGITERLGNHPMISNI